MDDEQFGFRNGFGTRQLLLSIMVLMQKCRNQQKDAFVAFIDYDKAFDRVKHMLLMECIHKRELDPNDIRIIKNTGQK